MDVSGLLSPATDVVNRGIASILGSPVDATAGLLSLLGYENARPVGGAEWIGDQMQRLGAVTATRRPLAEDLVTLAMPLGGAIKLVKAPINAVQIGQKAVSENVRKMATDPQDFSDFTFLLTPRQQEMLIKRQTARGGQLPDRYSVLVSKSNKAHHPTESRPGDGMSMSQIGDLFEAVYDGRNQIGIDKGNSNKFFLVNQNKDFGFKTKGVGLFEIRDGAINPLTAYPASETKVTEILMAPKKGKK